MDIKFIALQILVNSRTGENKKIEIKIIENEDDRLISFSKQCIGIYKKISKLSIICGGEILFIIFLLAGKPYSFGLPSVESVVKRFLNPDHPFNETTGAPVEVYYKVRINLLVKDFNEVYDQLDVLKEKQKTTVLAQQSHGTATYHRWEKGMFY
ncbi:hypothetical protein ES332_A05G162500v1 [Gossypium tomentosum]|uniref:MADS-box domain-containing protein n=1 Tax=Gossypium tomentosum TaxID=34277 RepID=A0A5D2QIG3_GOSTO|nr:hypothetical protein ES332_A05G162500v1 [Gossypium tomentosum]